nr:histidine kinase [Pedobacter panaciterrae]
MSLSLTDLAEDKYGRIWCHNFSGQLFYTENEKLQLLHAYNDNYESRFPRLVLTDDELVATTNKGVFVCNLKTLKSKYLSVKGKNNATTSLVRINQEVIAYGNGSWYCYSGEKGLQPLKVAFSLSNVQDFYLHPVHYKDTLFLTSPSSGQIKKVMLKGDSVKLLKSEITDDFINTIIVHQQKLWVNTKTHSYSTTGNQHNNKLNLTDIVTDSQGNTWYSSLKNGIMVRYCKPDFVINNFVKANKGDFVRSMGIQGNFIVSGTQNGQVIVYNTTTNQELYRIEIPEKSGSVERISRYFNGNFLISASVDNYVLDVKTKKLTRIDHTISKDSDYHKNLFFNATSKTITIRTPIVGDYKTETVKSTLFPSMTTGVDEWGQFLNKDVRCRALRYDSLTKNLYVALINGLHIINKNGIKPIYYKNRSINTSSIAYSKDGLFAADFNRGLMIFKGDSIQNFSIANGLLSNTLLKIKLFGDNLWIIGKKGIQLFNTRNRKIVGDLQLPTLEQGIVYDVLEFENKACIATSEGIYEVELQTKKEPKILNNSLLYALINNTDTVFSGGKAFPYYKNNILFELSAPWFSNPQGIYFKYRLHSESNHEWTVTDPRERKIHFPSLSPGYYTFEAQAIAASGEVATKAIKFDFTIKKPWWSQIWFLLLSALLLLGIVFASIWIYFRLRLKKEVISYEKKLAVELERQRIGSEIHDDISAGLSALHLQTSLTEQKAESAPIQQDITKINLVVRELSSQLREVIWALNTDHDSLENLIYYIQQQASLFFHATGIELKVKLPAYIPEHSIEGEKRRQIYLAIKESFQNIIKHSSATLVKLIISMEQNLLTIEINDNGIGFAKKGSIESAGIKNMAKRMEKIGANLKFGFDNGTSIYFYIPFKDILNAHN